MVTIQSRKRAVKEASRAIATRLGIYEPAKATYRAFFNREERRHFSEACNFLRPFIPAGSLVFDIGANRGEMIERYVALGARVVAVEPNPTLVELLRGRFRSASVTVLPYAVGDEPGHAELHVCSQDSHSTLSDRRVEACTSGRDAHILKFEQTVNVEVVTLDQLIDQHGGPAHCKIDVEGFEDAVFRGMSKPIESIAFEYNLISLDLIDFATSHLASFGQYEYNFTRMQRLDMHLDEWQDGPGLVNELKQLADEVREESYGDVYARRIG